MAARRTLAVLVLLALASCVPSWQPWLTEKDAIPHDALVGTWTHENETLVFTEAKDGLRLAWTKGDATDHLQCVYGRIGTREVLDVVPLLDGEDSDSMPSSDDGDTYAAIHTVAMHGLLSAHVHGGTLDIAPLDADWLDAYLKKHPHALAHVRRDEPPKLLLTASTAELQAFARRHDRELFIQDPTGYERSPAP